MQPNACPFCGASDLVTPQLLSSTSDFDPECYSILIRKETLEGETLYVGRVTEFPHISAFETTFEAAHNLVLDAIRTLKKIADEQHASFPSPTLID